MSIGLAFLTPAAGMIAIVSARMFGCKTWGFRAIVILCEFVQLNIQYSVFTNFIQVLTLMPYTPNVYAITITTGASCLNMATSSRSPPMIKKETYSITYLVRQEFIMTKWDYREREEYMNHTITCILKIFLNRSTQNVHYLLDAHSLWTYLTIDEQQIWICLHTSLFAYGRPSNYSLCSYINVYLRTTALH